MILTAQVVPQASAIVPGSADAERIAIQADHTKMVKFASRDDGGYRKVSGHLQLLAKAAPDAIGARWAEADKMKGEDTRHQPTRCNNMTG